MANAQQVKNRILDMILDNELTQDDWVEIIQLIAGGIGFKSIKQCADELNLFYQGALKSPKIKIFYISKVKVACKKANNNQKSPLFGAFFYVFFTTFTAAVVSM